MTSFISMVGRMIVILQSSSCDSLEILKFESNAFDKILDFIKRSNVGETTIIWNIIQKQAVADISNFPYIPNYEN